MQSTRKISPSFSFRIRSRFPNRLKRLELVSPMRVLTKPGPAQLLRSDEIGRIQGGMTVN